MSLDDRDERFGYGEYEGMLVGKDAALADWRFKKEQQSFERLIAVLRARKWAKANPDRVRETARRNEPKHRAYRAAWKRQKRDRKRAARKLTCAHCRAEFAAPKGKPPAYCARPCLLAARRLRRVTAVPCACGQPMTGRRERCRSCAQRARRAMEAARG